jgi:hypothetical protein
MIFAPVKASSMQAAAGQGASSTEIGGQFVIGRVTNLLDPNMHPECLSGERMVSVDRELAVSDARDLELTSLAKLVLHLYLGTNEPKLWRDVLDVIGEGEIGIVRSEALVGTQGELDLVADTSSTHGRVHPSDELGLATMDVADWNVRVLQDVTLTVFDSIGQGHELAGADDVVWHTLGL